MTNIKSNIWKIYTYTFLHELLFIAAIIVPFLGHLGLTMQEILVTEAVYAVSIVALEIPSGYFADRIGRKASIIFSAIFWIVGTSFYAFANTFELILVGAFFWGVGSSFSSGAQEAILYETLVQLKKEDQYKKVQGSIFFVGRIAAIIASIAGGLMASIHIKIPMYATLVTVIIWFFLSFTLIETRHKKEMEEHETWNHIKKILKESLIHNRQLRYFLLFTAVGGFFAIEFWLNQRFWGYLNIPIVYFGLIVAGMSFCSGLSSKYAKEIEEKLGEKISLILIPVIPIFVWLIYSGVSYLWIISLAFISSALRGYQVPIFNDFIQKHTTSDRRATIISIQSFLQRLVFFIFAPFLGWITDIYSIQTAFLCSAGILSIFTIISLLLLRKVKII